MHIPILLLVFIRFDTNNILHTFAFTPSRQPINIVVTKYIRDQQRRTTVLFAKKKNGGGKKAVPKMPTLPVVSTASKEDYDFTTSTTSDFYYSTSNNQRTTTQVSTMVVMDVENIRGATSFRISHESLLSRIRLWREDRLEISSQGSGILEPLLWICDHGMKPSIHHFSPFGDTIGNNDNDVQMPHNFGAIFAGPGGRTADDVIVDLVELRCGGGRSRLNDNIKNTGEHSEEDSLQSTTHDSLSRNSTIVVTADARLITRCQQARRQSNSLSDVIFVEPASLLQQLERYRINSNEEESLFGKTTAPSLTMSPAIGSRGPIDNNKRVDGKTNSMTSFKDSTIAMEQHAKFQARFQNNKNSDTIEKKQEAISSNEEKEEEEEEEEVDEVQSTEQLDNTNGSNALAAQLKTEQIRRQLLLSDAYYLARPRKDVRGRVIHAKFKNRNISKKQQKKLYAKRFGNKRKEDMVSAATKRKQLAAKLQMNLERIDPDSFEEAGDAYCNGVEGESGMIMKSMRLLETLLGKFETERLHLSENTGSSESHITGTSASSDPSTVLGLDRTTGKVGSGDKWDPLGSTINVPLRKNAENNDTNLPPLRVVVISDTHGFEGALARFANEEDSQSKLHSDDFLLPQADVLLHCGDFAASGSRKTQRQAARRLDDFLARQTHIPEKIVIKGNHDPESPSKVLFPTSKALYVRSSSTLVVNGVSFTLEPFSRRMAFRSIRRRSSSYAMPSLPKCDILVTHEPPKGCLDLTYHGFSAGSMYLRELVEHSEHKPRLWVCGHIHESRGLSKLFQENEDASTMVINASNANSGRANRLVSGAVVVEIERCPSNTGGDETAESTLQTRKIEYSDDFEDSVNGQDLAELGNELEVYVTRPGVRRRKGVPLSVRQQMKNVRSSLS